MRAAMAGAEAVVKRAMMERMDTTLGESFPSTPASGTSIADHTTPTSRSHDKPCPSTTETFIRALQRVESRASVEIKAEDSRGIDAGASNARVVGFSSLTGNHGALD
jgi:hypothetical protein